MYQHIDPAIGASTHSHGTDIRGNIKIFYTVIIDHGNLVGDGQVNVSHIDSGSAPITEFIRSDGSGGAVWAEPPSGGGGGGTDDQTAAEVTVDTTNFSRNLTAADDSVQDALETIDGFTQYQGAWQQASWPAGVIVTRSGIAYLSLVNNNTEIPTPAAEGWSGLPEGYIYRGEAPVAATVYNYGHIVFSPTTDNYYFFTSTISASVARADIPTHVNFSPVTHKLTNAEATDDLSTVYGAVTGELIAGAVAAHEDVANSAALVYTQNTRNLALTIGRTVGASLSTQVVIPALTQAQAEDDASTVPGLVTGELMAQAVAAGGGGGGGGGGSTDRIVLLDGETYSPGAARNFDFTEDIPARHLLTFEIVGTATGYAIMLSDDLLALTAQSGGPSTSANSYPMYTRNHSNSLPTQNQGNSWLVWREDADSIYFRESRGSGGTLTITATPLGGGSTGGQQAAAGRTLVQRNIITARTPLAEFSFTTDWGLVSGTAPTFTAIPKADFDRIELGFYVNSAFTYPIVLTRAMVTEMGPTPDPLTVGLVDSDTIPGAFLTFRTNATFDSREPVLLSPKYGFMQARSSANRCGVFVAHERQLR